MLRADGDKDFSALHSHSGTWTDNITHGFSEPPSSQHEADAEGKRSNMLSVLPLSLQVANMMSTHFLLDIRSFHSQGPKGK